MENKQMVLIEKRELEEMLKKVIKENANTESVPKDDKWLTVNEAASISQVTPATILNRRKRGDYKNVRKEGKNYLFSLREISRGAIWAD